MTSTVPSSSSQYNEAPELAAAVAAGALLPVSERLPDVPKVIVPFNEIGKYGGELRFGLSELGNMDPIRARGKPEELQALAVFLASKSSSFVNGQVIVVDDGLSAVIL